MALKKLLLYRLLKRNKKLGLLYVGYKAAKYGLGMYRKKRKVLKKRK